MNPVIFDWFRVAVEGVLAPLPFFETQGVMLQQDGLPDMWSTMEATNSSMDRLSVGVPALWREAGVVTVVFLVQSGRGPREALVAAQKFADTMREPTNYQHELVETNGIEGSLRLESIGSPEADPYEDGNWLSCAVACVYTYDSVRGAALVSP